MFVAKNSFSSVNIVFKFNGKFTLNSNWIKKCFLLYWFKKRKICQSRCFKSLITHLHFKYLNLLWMRAPVLTFSFSSKSNFVNLFLCQPNKLIIKTWKYRWIDFWKLFKDMTPYQHLVKILLCVYMYKPNRSRSII